MSTAHAASATDAPTHSVDLSHIHAFLGCRTPEAWIQEALKAENFEVLMLDHANCEKKAAGTALNLMFRYEPFAPLQTKLAQLVREEMLHFEQVLALMDSRGITLRHITAGRYAGSLLKHKRTHEPASMIDILIIGALIEARSCERFDVLSKRIGDKELARYYRYLLKSESRHFEDYLELAQSLSTTSIEDRIAFFVKEEALLIESPDPEFRFHSGVPVAA